MIPFGSAKPRKKRRGDQRNFAAVPKDRVHKTIRVSPKIPKT